MEDVKSKKQIIMSEGVYQKCEMCGNRVHINHTCKQWNKAKECQWDPWGVRKNIQSKIDNLRQEIRDTEFVLNNKRSSLEKNIEKLLKTL